MYEVIPLTSWDIPELEPYKTMRRPMEHRKQGIFVAEGEKVVRRMLESSIEVVSLVLPEKWLEVYKPFLEQRPEMIRVYVGEKAVLEQLSGFTFYQGVIGIGRIPQLPSLDVVLEKTPMPNLWIAADRISSAGNMGVICRSAGALGAQAILVGETSCTPYVRWAVHASMGELFKLNILETESLRESLLVLKSKGIRCVAAHPHASGKTLAQCNFKSPVCLVFGSEGEGVSPEVLEVCDESVAVPMFFGVDSLNVANCVGIFLYEVQRQRGLMG